MNSLAPLIGGGADFGIGIAKHFFVARGVVGHTRLNIPVPQSIASPFDCEFPALLALPQGFLGLLAPGDFQEGRDEMIGLVLIADTVVPATIGLQVLLEPNGFTCPCHAGEGANPIEGILLYPRKGCGDVLAPGIDACQFDVLLIGIKEEIVGRLPRFVIDHAVISHGDRTLLEQGLELPLRLLQGRLGLLALSDVLGKTQKAVLADADRIHDPPAQAAVLLQEEHLPRSRTLLHKAGEVL